MITVDSCIYGHENRQMIFADREKIEDIRKINDKLELRIWWLITTNFLTLLGIAFNIGLTLSRR